ncbi:MAG: B12-binding domain-containing radical SAM protein [Candidatus Bathyarchaeota archaeon]|nr:B12-binding domain-containing radical SAM protein [Candidatus Bathyarchaeota archaeon]MDH5787544.1 B12-binding domain-containing radical SAM protein [Candidatus Bathyarchaeota archaeon]
MPEILLTADRTLMSDYHHNEFIGFGTCAPPNFIPNWLYGRLFFPPIKTKRGIPIAAPYGLRKIEAQLLGEGFDALTVDPDHIREYINEAKVLGIHVMDPFGLGPASSTLAAIFKKEPFLAQYFRILMEKTEIKKAKRRGLKIIVGGPGVWQFRFRPRFVKEYGIDCIIEGEAEKVIAKIVRAAFNDGTLPQYYTTGIQEIPRLEEIPDIVNPSINGLIEAGRGCCRGCEFCSVTLRPLRWYSYEKILREIDVNIKIGRITWCCLQAEDIMLYGSKNTLPDEDKLIRLNELAVKKCEGLSWSHCSLASIASKPKLFSEVSEIILRKQPWWGAEVGIETGSPELAKKVMPAKAHPFKPEEWPKVVRTGMGLMHDNKLIPACTLIVGTPEETESDLIKTIELMDDLKDIRSLIVPLFFVPLGRLKDEGWFKEAQLTQLHKELLIKCFEHDFHWIDNLIDLAFPEKWYASFLQIFYRFFARLAEHRVERAGISRNRK